MREDGQHRREWLGELEDILNVAPDVQRTWRVVTSWILERSNGICFLNLVYLPMTADLERRESGF